MSRICLLLSLLAACGNVADNNPPGDDDDGVSPDGDPGDDDGGPQPGTAARAAFVFPPASGLTEGPAITVRGTAVDPDGIVAVRVNGIAALSGDGFATWQAEVALALGNNELVVEVEDARGDVVTRAAATTIASSPNPWASMSSIAVEQSLFPTQPFFVSDERLEAILAVDPATGARTVVSSPRRGNGPALPVPAQIVFDNARGRIIAGGFGGVFAVDPATGNRTAINTDSLFSVLAMSLDGNDTVLVLSQPIFGDPFLERVNVLTGARTTVSGAGVGNGPAFVTARDVVVDLLNNRAFVADAGAKAVYRVDLANGNRTVISGAGIGAGPNFDNPSGITIDRSFAASSTQAWVADAGRDAVIRIDLANGNRTILSANGTGAGDAIGNAKTVNFTSAGDLLLADNVNQTLFRIDIATGNRTSLSASRVGSGPAHTLANGAGFTTGIVFVSDQQDGIFRFDFATATRTQIAMPSADIVLPSGVVVEPSGTTALFATAAPKLVRVSTAGATSIVSASNLGTGPALPLLAELDLDPAGGRVFAGGQASIFAVDLVTGNRTVISDSQHGTGPAFGGITGVRVDGTRLLATDISLDAVLAVDIASGNRITLSNASTGSGPALIDPTGIAVAGTTAFVVDQKADALFAVDTASGNRTIVSGTAQRGPALSLPQHVTALPEQNLALVSDFAMGLVAIDLATGHRVIISH